MDYCCFISSFSSNCPNLCIELMKTMKIKYLVCCPPKNPTKRKKEKKVEVVGVPAGGVQSAVQAAAPVPPQVQPAQDPGSDPESEKSKKKKARTTFTGETDLRAGKAVRDEEVPLVERKGGDGKTPQRYGDAGELKPI
ncbi:hypothetical protein CEXT_751751 [Caerostris extrusa]|uniref:Uncharacterized protein n=1 Tax=Caerostris extrusa TaxID=172846 RepID=A0AAV4NP76_CAEEX|nr:hypothetical protein CEXT_751751 [Caerostris extrusa]